MTSGWDVYYVVFLSALLALMFPGFLGLVSRLAGARQARRDESSGESLASRAPRESRTDLPSLGRRVNTRFFLGANVALALLTLAFVLVPCVGAIQEDPANGASVAAASGIAFVAVLAGVALLYAARKGDLDWLRTHRGKDEPGR
jgi:NADH:ubiquinone oxidoreductase subunit 3 (subunit A)